MNKYNGKILIVDDNKELLEALSMFLSQYFIEVKTISNPNLLQNLLKQESFDLILLDMNFSAGVNTGNEGLFWLKEISRIDPHVAVIFITAYGDISLAVQSMKEGAVDFIQKSWEEEKILSTIISAYKLRNSKLEISKLKKTQEHLTQELGKNQDVIKCQSPQMQKVYETINKIADTDANILITGENGTGKEVIARMIHNQSQRKHHPFIHIDLGAIHESLFESELFGYVKGAYTDAKIDKASKLEIGNGGTIFLDEIGNLDITLQTKLLSIIQNKEVVRVGSNKTITLDIRLITATNQDLFDLSKQNNFRQDLLYRINTINIELPPLRERPEDIEVIAIHFLNKYNKKYQKQISLNASAINKMKQYSWPGNIRELQHAIEKAVILSEGDYADPSVILPGKRKENNLKYHTLNLEENEKEIIKQALASFKWNITKASEILGIDRTTLYAKIKKYELK